MKSKFITSLNCRLGDTDKIWILNKPLIYYSELLDTTIEVPAEFQTDFASVPRVPIVYWFYGGRAHHEAVIHDYLYRIDSMPVVAKNTADKVFLEAMKVRGKPFLVRHPMYLGVVVGGGSSYHKKVVDIKCKQNTNV